MGVVPAAVDRADVPKVTTEVGARLASRGAPAVDLPAALGEASPA